MSSTIPKYTVLRDTSEHEGYGWIFAPTDRCNGTVDKNLYTADYSIEGYYDSKQFVIERKGAVAELVQNITVKEKWADFKDELMRLEEFDKAFIICEFPLKLIKTYPVGSAIPEHLHEHIKVKPQFLLKRLEEIWLTFRTKWIFADNNELAKDIASGLFKRIVENVKPETA